MDICNANETHNEALDAWLKELEAIVATLMPTEPHPGIVMEPDFRRLVILSPSPLIVEAAIDSVKDYAIKKELCERAERLENDMTAFDCQKRRFHNECRDMSLAQNRQGNGTLSDAPEALKQLRRLLKDDIARLKKIIDDMKDDTVTQQASARVMAELVPHQAALLEQAAHTNKKKHLDRAKGMTDKVVAAMFNKKAQPLVRKIIEAQYDRNCEYTAIVKEYRDKGKTIGFVELGKYKGYGMYEPQRGGDRSGYAKYGTLTKAGFRKWLKNYPNSNSTHPDCGFHAGLLKDPAALAKCADIWGRHCKEYALQFYEWRKIHKTAPRKHFRFERKKEIHGAEKIATSS